MSLLGQENMYPCSDTHHTSYSKRTKLNGFDGHKRRSVVGGEFSDQGRTGHGMRTGNDRSLVTHVLVHDDDATVEINNPSC